MQTLLSMVALCCISLACLRAGPVEVDLSQIVNTSWTTFPMLLNGVTFPTGQHQFASVPFNIPGSPNNVWSADVAASGALHAGMVSVTVPIELNDATTVFTLINNEWGQTGGAYASLTFNGSAGATVTTLLGNYNIRDFNQNQWTNSTLAPTTQQVWANDLGQRLDMQTIDLQGLFLNQVLISMTLSDWGDHVNVGNIFDIETHAQRTFLSGVTVGTTAVPEPGTIVLLLGGVGVLGLWRKKAYAWRRAAR